MVRVGVPADTFLLGSWVELLADVCPPLSGPGELTWVAADPVGAAWVGLEAWVGGLGSDMVRFYAKWPLFLLFAAGVRKDQNQIKIVSQKF